MNGIDLAWNPGFWDQSIAWQTHGFRRRDPQFGTQAESWIFYMPCACGCGHGCSFWSALDLGPGVIAEPEVVPYEEPPLPMPAWSIRKSGYFGAAASAWRNSLKLYPRPMEPWQIPRPFGPYLWPKLASFAK